MISWTVKKTCGEIPLQVFFLLSGPYQDNLAVAAALVVSGCYGYIPEGIALDGGALLVAGNKGVSALCALVGAAAAFAAVISAAASARVLVRAAVRPVDAEAP